MGAISFAPLTIALVLAVPVGYLVLQLRALQRWDGVWRQAAQWSAWSMVGLVALVALRYITGTGGSLLLIFLALPIAAGYVLGLTVAYRLVHD